MQQEGQKGCFSVSSMREFPILPPEAVAIITRSRSKLKQLIAKNIEVERPKMNADSLAELILTFFTGLSMEHNLSSSRPSNSLFANESEFVIIEMHLTRQLVSLKTACCCCPCLRSLGRRETARTECR
jgi:hypothetical protein